jgi:hypothetical protein
MTNNLTHVKSVAEGLGVKGELVARTTLVACALEISELRKYMVHLLDGKIEEEKLPRSLQDSLEQIREDEKRATYCRR